MKNRGLDVLDWFVLLLGSVMVVFGVMNREWVDVSVAACVMACVVGYRLGWIPRFRR